MAPGALGLGALACVAAFMLWQKLANIQEQLARQSQQATIQSGEALAVAKQAMALTQEAVARAAVLDARLSEVALQRGQLDDLMQSLSRSRDENLVVDIEAGLRLAQQQAQLSGSIEPLLAALRGAEQRVARAAQPRLAPLQRALARDIDRVKASAVSDTPTLLTKLAELVRLADLLVLAQAVGPSTRAHAAPARAASAPASSWWQSALTQVAQEARALVRVNRIEAPEAVLLSPEQGFFVRENLKLRLLNARLGALARQTEPTRTDLSQVELTIKKYFDSSSRNTHNALVLITQVQAQLRNLQLPRIDDTLAALTTAAAGR
ncbi:MAG: hypothetical protein Fur007_19130 [Rhodoferax sp.]